MSSSYWLSKKKYDYLIEGAGISGLSLAFHLQEKFPKALIAIRDPKHMGAGATGRNAGFLTVGSTKYFGDLVSKYGEIAATEIFNCYRENHNLLKQNFNLKNCDYLQKGSTTYSVSEEEKDLLREHFIIMKRNGLPVKEISESPFLSGILFGEDAAINPIKLLKEISQKLKSVDFLFGEEFKEVEFSTRIIATNGYTTNTQIKPARGQIVLFDTEGREISKHLGYQPKNLIYFNQVDRNNFIIGGARTVDPQTEETTEIGDNDKIQNHLVLKAKEFFGLTKIVSKWSGIMGMTPDHQPIVGKLGQDFVSAGFSGHGMGLAFMAAKTLVDNLETPEKIPEWMNSLRFK